MLDHREKQTRQEVTRQRELHLLAEMLLSLYERRREKPLREMPRRQVDNIPTDVTINEERSNKTFTLR